MKYFFIDLYYKIQDKYTEFKFNRKNPKRADYAREVNNMKVIQIITIVILGIFLFLLSLGTYVQTKYDVKTQQSEEQTENFSKRDVSYLDNYKEISEAQKTIIKDLEEEGLYFGDSLKNKSVTIYKENNSITLFNCLNVTSTSYGRISKESDIFSASVSIINLSTHELNVDFEKSNIEDIDGNREYFTPDSAMIDNSKMYTTSVQGVSNYTLDFKLENKLNIDKISHINLVLQRDDAPSMVVKLKINNK